MADWKEALKQVLFIVLAAIIVFLGFTKVAFSAPPADNEAKPVAVEVQALFDDAADWLNSIGIPAQHFPVYYGDTILNGFAETGDDYILIDNSHYRMFLVEAHRKMVNRRGFNAQVHHLILHEVAHTITFARMPGRIKYEDLERGRWIEEGLVEAFSDRIWHFYVKSLYGPEAWKFAKFKLYYAAYSSEVKHVYQLGYNATRCKRESRCMFNWIVARLIEPFPVRKITMNHHY